MKEFYDVAIAGGGASGLCAAFFAAKKGARVILLESADRVGKKILLTGNGRCNLSNADISNKHYHGSIGFADEIMRDFSAVDFFYSLGLVCKTDSEGRIYPRSNTAASVLDALRLGCKANNVCERTGFGVCKVKKCDTFFEICDKSETVFSKSVIFACCTPTEALSKLGIKTAAPLPSLCPIQVKNPAVRALRGLRVSGVASAFLHGKCIKSEYGEIQFAEDSLSGICIFNLSRLASQYGRELSIVLNLMPEYDENKLFALLSNIAKIRKNEKLEDFLSGIFAKRIGTELIKAAKFTELSRKCNLLSDDDIRKIARIIRAWRFEVSGVPRTQGAQVMSGGVLGGEITHELEAKKTAGLFFCGEILDIDGDCGGFNLNWAWASGKIAGEAAARLALK